MERCGWFVEERKKKKPSLTKGEPRENNGGLVKEDPLIFCSAPAPCVS